MAGGGRMGGRTNRDGGEGLRGMYRSEDSIPQQGGINPGTERALREGLRELRQMREGLNDSPELAQDVDAIMRELQKYDPQKIASDPLLAERIRSSVIPAIQQLEVQLRRKLESATGDVRTSSSQKVPEGYGAAVAEYFRKLSKTTR